VIAEFLVDRPIFATVISVVFVLAGGVAVFTLPVAQYPDVTSGAKHRLQKYASVVRKHKLMTREEFPCFASI